MAISRHAQEGDLCSAYSIRLSPREHVKVSLEKGEAPQDQLFEVDQIIIAAGQEPFEDLSSRFNGKGMPIHVIGGARETSGLDAKVAIREGAELAARL